MRGKAYVDGILLDWGASLFNEPPSLWTKGIPRNTLTGRLPKLRKGAGQRSALVSTADDVRAKLRAIAKRAPEVMVKISGGGKGMVQIKNHMDYISRNGQIELETHDGEVVKGRRDLEMLRDEWKYGGFQVAEESETKDAFNIVLSMPEGTPPLAVRSAARDFASVEFAGHQYVMALHTYDTDPDPEPARHPHVHLTVKARGLDGTRLNPRKADLQRWREGFAGALRDHGVEASATSRQVRLNRGRGETKAVSEMRRRGVELERIGKSKAAEHFISQAKITETIILKGYGEVVKALAQSELAEDRELASDVVARLQSGRGMTADDRAQHPPASGFKDRER